MKLVGFTHKGLKRLYEDDQAKGVPPAMVQKLRHLLLAMETAETLDQLGRFPGWNLHPLKGDKRGFWSLTVTGNWRVVFLHDKDAGTASGIDLIDYH